MSLSGLLTLASVLLAVLLLTPLLGGLIHAALEGRRTLLTPIFGPVERVIYRLAGVDPSREQGWKAYSISFITFTFASCCRHSRR